MLLRWVLTRDETAVRAMLNVIWIDPTQVAGKAGEFSLGMATIWPSRWIETNSPDLCRTTYPNTRAVGFRRRAPRQSGRTRYFRPSRPRHCGRRMKWRLSGTSALVPRAVQRKVYIFALTNFSDGRE